MSNELSEEVVETYKITLLKMHFDTYLDRKGVHRYRSNVNK